MVLPQLVQKQLYAFLRHGFEKWPLDSSFRLVGFNRGCHLLVPNPSQGGVGALEVTYDARHNQNVMVLNAL